MAKAIKLSLVGKVAVVTGAASGIGRASALRLAQAGAALLLLDVDAVHGEQAAAEIRSQGGTAEFLACDVTSAEDCRRAAQFARERFGRVDVLFNNAGVIRRKSVVDLSEDEWDLVLGVGLKSVFLVSKHMLPLMAETGGGSVINAGSGWGLTGGPNAAAYCAAKGGVVNLTRAMAIDHGPQGIRVNCVCPGDTDTPMLRDEARQLGIAVDAFLAESAARPLPRLGQPSDIGDAVLFLASDLAQWVTGAILAVDGGGTAG